jgi:hypothetical protein
MQILAALGVLVIIATILAVLCWVVWITVEVRQNAEDIKANDKSIMKLTRRVFDLEIGSSKVGGKDEAQD